MKNITLSFIMLFCSFAINAQTSLSKTINANGVSRAYRIYIPAMYNAANAVPLVFNFHGYTSNNIQQEFYGDFRPVADTANFILVHPQGLLINGSTGFNNFGVVGSLPDDIGFIDHLIDTVKSLYNINLNKVYSTGLSNGGFMSYDLACLLSTRFTAIASVSGSMVSSHISACDPSHPLPVMQIHGTADPTVSYNGTGGILTSTHIDTLVKYWVTKNNCNITPVMTTVANTSSTDGCTAERYVYSNGAKGSTVELFKIIGGGHTWPGASINTGVTNQDIIASKEIWRFFNQYSLDKLVFPSSVHSVNKLTDFIISNNPSHGVYLFNSTIKENFILDIYNTMGVKIKTIHMNQSNQEIDIREQANGLYYYIIKNSRQDFAKGKLIKQ
jgi:polyhydroxybutyrate depolymerase